MNFNIFDRIKLNQEKKKYKYEFSEVIKYVTPEFIRLCENKEDRANIYTHFNYELVAPEFPYFIELYKDSKLIAMNAIKYANGIDEEKVEFLKKNKTKLNILLENNIINSDFFHLGNEKIIDEYINILNHYGKDIAKNINKNNFEFYNNKNILNLENEFVKNNIDELKTIYKLSDIKFNCLLKYYQKNMNKYEIIKKIFLSEDKTFSDEIIEFLEQYDFDENLITVLKENNIYKINSLHSQTKIGLNYKITPDFFISNEFYNYEKFSKISINFLMNYYKKTNSIDNFRSIILSKVTNSVISGCSNEILKEKFYNYLSEENRFYLDTLLKIENSNSILKIESLVNELEMKKFDINKFIFQIKKIESQLLNKKLFIPKENMGYINEDGIRIIEYGPELKDFKMFVHSIGKSDHEYHHDDMVEILLNDPSAWTSTNGGSEFMSCSLLTENGLGTYSHDIVLGFAEEDFDITETFNTDAKTPMGVGWKKIFFSAELNDFSPEDINYAGMIKEFSGTIKRGPYNEICIQRNKKIIPKYIVVTKNCNIDNPYNETVKKWAKFYDIPVIVLDYEKIKKKAIIEIKEKLIHMKNEGIKFEVFIEMLHNIDIIKNNEDKYNYYEIFDYMINLCENNYENYIEFKKIIELAGDNITYLLTNDIILNIGQSNYEIAKEDRENKIKEFYEKLQYLSNKYEMENEVSLNKLGFTAINYIFLSLLFILVIILFYIFI